MEDDFTPLETTRLVLRRFRRSDLESFQAYRVDPDVAMYQGWGTEFSIETARKFIEQQLQIAPGTLGSEAQIAIERKGSRELVGDVFLNTPDSEAHQAGIGYTLAPEHQGQGYATEAVRRVIDYAFGALDKHRVTASTYSENERSVALLERIGMRREAHFVRSEWFRERWVDVYGYAVLQSEWLGR